MQLVMTEIKIIKKKKSWDGHDAVGTPLTLSGWPSLWRHFPEVLTYECWWPTMHGTWQC